ncbi:MAG: glutamate-cysteine ligase family protein [Halohasta sp.]
MTGHETPVRRSIEIEYWVVDEAGHLTEPEGLVGASPGVEREFVAPLLEIKTSPCESTAELRTELFDRLRAVCQRADELGKRLVPLSTPLNHETIAELPSDRTRIQNRVIGDSFQYVRHCAGTHIHVEQQPGAAIDQLNTLIALDPALALVNSAPHFRGRPLAVGARSELYRRLAYAGVDHQGQLWPYAADREEWTDRLAARYEEFAGLAADAGVDPAAVEAAFAPESAVWTPVQLRETFGTVEWRSPDATLPGEAVRLAETIADLVGRLDDATVRIEGSTGRVSEAEIVLPEFEALRDYVDAAIDEGLGDPRVRAYLDRMGFDVDAYEPIARDLVGRGPVTPAEARSVRLEYADRLRAAVDRPPSLEAD